MQTSIFCKVININTKILKILYTNRDIKRFFQLLLQTSAYNFKNRIGKEKFKSARYSSYFIWTSVYVIRNWQNSSQVLSSPFKILTEITTKHLKMLSVINTYKVLNTDKILIHGKQFTPKCNTDGNFFISRFVSGKYFISSQTYIL